MTQLRTTVQSFDLFDTLVARACVTPANLFSEVEATQGMPGFAQQRMDAEGRIAAQDISYSLDAIYQALHISGFCDAATARRLCRAEINAEFDNAIPITQNLNAVRDGDLVVSDMYLPAPILRGLLQHVGLRRQVHLIVTNSGKNKGTIWRQLTNRWLLLHHTGDNIHADVTQPQRFGIHTRHYVGSCLNLTEQFLHNHGLIQTARLIRRLRLSNPMLPFSVEANLWDHFVQFNVPLLLLATRIIRSQRDELGLSKILFLTRDCHFLSEIFLSMYPEEPMDLVMVSRDALRRQPDVFASYLRSMDIQNCLVCDLVSTGYSWLQFTKMMRFNIAFFALVYTDTFQYNLFDPVELETNGYLRFRYGLRSAELNHWSLAIELLNTAPHGSTQSIELVGRDYIPTFETPHELPHSYLKTLTHAQANTIQWLRPLSTSIDQELGALKDPRSLASAMVSALSGTDWINHLAVSAICNITT